MGETVYFLNNGKGVSSFEGAKLISVNFVGTNLTGAFLRNAMLTNAYLPDTIIANANFRWQF